VNSWQAGELEYVLCDHCGAECRTARYTRGDGMAVVCCGNCALAFLNPRPRPELVPTLYDPAYFTGEAAATRQGGLRLDLGAGSGHGSLQREQLDWVTQTLTLRQGALAGRRILEIGCATGDLLQALQERGVRGSGVELSAFAAEHARGRGLDVFCGTLEEYSARCTERFDAILAFELIEHVLSPAAFLGQVAKLLQPGGLLLLSTPNFACTRRYGAQWSGLTGSFEHLYFFDQATLGKLTAAKGFVPVTVESTKYLGGPLRPFGLIGRWRERLRTLRYFIGEIGLVNTLKAVSDRAAPAYPFALGHTLRLAFRLQPDA